MKFSEDEVAVPRHEDVIARLQGPHRTRNRNSPEGTMRYKEHNLWTTIFGVYEYLQPPL